MLVSILTRFLIGYEFSFGIIIYVLISIIYGEQVNGLLLVGTIISAHIPDGDFILYVILKKYLPIKSHRIIGHHPILVLPLVWTAGQYIDHAYCNYSHDQYYIPLLFTLATFMHFVHDSMESHGLHWFSPFWWKSISLKGRPHWVNWDFVRQVIRDKERSRTVDGSGEVLSRMPNPKKLEYAVSLSGLILLIVYVQLL